MISPDARIINHNTQKTWHYIFAKSTPRALQYQWLIPRTHAATVEDQFDDHAPAWRRVRDRFWANLMSGR